MLKHAPSLLITAFLCLASPADSRMAHTHRTVTVKETPRGHMLSVNAIAAPLDNLLRDIGDQCRIRITCRGRCRLSQPVCIHFHDLTLEQAITQLIRAAGIHNYLIRYGDGGSGRQSITEVVVFGNRTMTEAAFNQSHTRPDEKQHGLSVDHRPAVASADAYEKQIASFKDRYRWEDEETRDWAVNLIEAMPDEVKDFGLDHIMQELDKVNDSEGTAAVNPERFYRAIEAAAPPGVAPAMMRQIRRLSKQYYDRRTAGKADTSRGGF
jgi:hypothetical protein